MKIIEKAIKKIVYMAVLFLLRKRGYSPYMANLLWGDLRKDMISKNGVSFSGKIWAYKRGFLSDRISRLGLTDANYKSFISDFAYLRLHPLNGAYSKWIDDKLTMRYVFSAYSEYMPKYYFQITDGCVSKLLDCQEGIKAVPDFNDIIDLLKKEGGLALKSLTGYGGEGFYKLSFENGEIFIDNTPSTLGDVELLLAGLNSYIVSEYLYAHQILREIYSVTPGTLRLMVVHDYPDEPKITGAFMQFGAKQSGMVDNACAGGVFCGVGLSKGELFNARLVDGSGRTIDTSMHPDTGVVIDGVVLPHWDFITEKIIEIAASFPQLSYMGFDVIITENSFKFIEINSHLGSSYIQSFYPLMENEDFVNFIEKKYKHCA